MDTISENTLPVPYEPDSIFYDEKRQNIFDVDFIFETFIALLYPLNLIRGKIVLIKRHLLYIEWDGRSILELC